jgi:hypothetical protein
MSAMSLTIFSLMVWVLMSFLVDTVVIDLLSMPEGGMRLLTR